MTKKITEETLELGKNYLVRAVTYHQLGTYTGTIDAAGKKLIILSNAAWVADSGRFTKCLRDGVLGEVEPVITKDGKPGRLFLNPESIVDMFEWEHALPKAAFPHPN
jgi:hypothetical protein